VCGESREGSEGKLLGRVTDAFVQQNNVRKHKEEDASICVVEFGGGGARRQQ